MDIEGVQLRVLREGDSATWLGHMVEVRGGGAALTMALEVWMWAAFGDVRETDETQYFTV